MMIEKSNFIKVLSREKTKNIPIYCTGYPESQFIENYIEIYKPKLDSDKSLILNRKNFNLIKQMGFDAISLWDFRRGPGEYQ